MQVSVGDITATNSQNGLPGFYDLLVAQALDSEMSVENFLKVNLDSLDRSDKNLMASEIRTVLSDALSTLRSSGQEIRDAGK